MSRPLNTVKLHQKFGMLTSTRESISGLSAWIMDHNEHMEEIVNEWLSCLSKDYDTLVMFYVANDILQKCGKKRLPEFRIEFAKAFEIAAGLQSVKDIKEKVIRLLMIWKERDIYDNEYCNRIKEKLNTIEISDGDSVDENEKSEPDIIATFKLEKLLHNLKTLTSLEQRVEEKVDILQNADEPKLSDIEDTIVHGNLKEMKKKCDKYVYYVEEAMKLILNEIVQRKNVLQDLEHCSIFYQGQSKDVKEVANAFRVYGKRVKNMENKVAEKLSSFLLPGSIDSPSLSENLVSPSVLGSESSYTERIEVTFHVTPTLATESDCGSVCDLDNAIPDKETAFQDEEQTTEEHLESYQEMQMNDCFNEYPDLSVLSEVISNIDVDLLKSTLALTTNLSADLPIEKPNDLKLEEAITNEIATVETKDTQQEDSTSCETVISEEKKLTPIECVVQDENMEISVKEFKNKLDAESLKTSENTSEVIAEEKEHIIKDNSAKDLLDVDDLLEEAYGKRAKSKETYKRKIALLLNSKGKKTCRREGDGTKDLDIDKQIENIAVTCDADAISNSSEPERSFMTFDVSEIPKPMEEELMSQQELNSRNSSTEKSDGASTSQTDGKSEEFTENGKSISSEDQLHSLVKAKFKIPLIEESLKNDATTVGTEIDAKATCESTLLSHNIKESHSTDFKNLNQSQEKIIEYVQPPNPKSNLIETLKSTLQHISENRFSEAKVTSSSKLSNTHVMPFQNMLKIYRILKYSKESKDSSLSVPLTKVPVVKVQTHLQVTSIQDNFEVMDMDCDSE